MKARHSALPAFTWSSAPSSTGTRFLAAEQRLNCGSKAGVFLTRG
jgi:hypothetical protein